MTATPEHPTADEFEAHAKVEDWWRHQAHVVAVHRGHFEMEQYGDSFTLITSHKRQQVSLEELIALPGFTGITNADGELVGWSKG